MPDSPPRKPRLHPIKQRPLESPPPPKDEPRLPCRRYAELHAVTNFSFLRGASHPDELVQQAAQLGYDAIAITDEHSLAGVVRAHVAAKPLDIKLLVGAELHPQSSSSLIALAPDRSNYAKLSRLLTLGRRRTEKGCCELHREDITDLGRGLLMIALPDPSVLHTRARQKDLQREVEGLRWIQETFLEDAWLAAPMLEGSDDRATMQRLEYLARHTGLPLVATGTVEAHIPERRPLRDVLHAIRHGCRVADLGRRVPPHGTSWLRSREELAWLYRERRDLLDATLEVADRCQFSLDELRYEYPDEIRGRDLRELVKQGAARRWPQGVPQRVHRLIERELALIKELQYENYFLTVYDIVRFAESRGILCQGRGSAANSAICYCLGITAVDPDRFDVLFERFVSKDRGEPPDIDVDFEHERREEVLQYIYRRYGRERAALAATVITYRSRSALREVGKAMGLSLDQVDRLSKTTRAWSWAEMPEPLSLLREAGLDSRDPTLRRVLHLAAELRGFPRHLSQHVGGMVITQGRLDEIVPIENAAMPERTVIQWDKDDLDALGLLKVDCLALGMLSAIRRAFHFMAHIRGVQMDLAGVPAEVEAIYAMASRADTVGVFQIESRAQMAMLPRFRPRCFYDLVIEIAIVRPGPIQGGMVHPYLRRRDGLEPVTYPSEDVRSVLEKTLGVPIFQEQAMRLAMVAAGFTPGEADQLRRAMAAWRRPGIIEQFAERLIQGMLRRGYQREFAEAVYRQIKGFGEYGFPESHAASFALLCYVSCWLKRFEPAIFAASLLNSQPMGFYQPAQLVHDARAHGVDVRGVDVTRSDFDCTLETDGLTLHPSPADPRLPPHRYGEGGPALRLGLRSLKGFSQKAAERLTHARLSSPFRSVGDCLLRARLDRKHARILARAGAFGALEPDRRQALWQASAPIEEAPLFIEEDAPQVAPALPPLSRGECVLTDYHLSGLSLVDHPISFLRPMLTKRRAITAHALRSVKARHRVTVAGLCLCRQRPGTASGILFVTLEDETGMINLIVRPRVQARHRITLATSQVFMAHGVVERERTVIHVMVHKVEDLAPWMPTIPSMSRDFQ